MKVTVEIPDDLAAELPGDDSARGRRVLLELACGLYAVGRLTHAQAASLAGMKRLEFECERGLRQIPIHYGEDDWREDLHGGMRD